MPKNIVKRFFTLTVFLAAFSLSGCLEESTSAESTSSTSSTNTTQTITNESTHLPAGSSVKYSISLEKTATINIDISVTDGDGVQIYLLDTQGLVNILNGMTTFSYYSDLSAPYDVTSFKKSATFPAGEWIVLIYNPSILSQTVRREISVNY